jgi:hypothetical protein
MPSENLMPSIGVPYNREILYPSDELYGKSFKLQVDETIYDLDINYLNYMNTDTFDEFIYENGECYIIRRVGINESGEMYKLQKEVKEKRKGTTINVIKDSLIILLGFANAIITATYLTQNDYTKTFATQVEVKSEIKVATDEINIEVAKKVNEDEVVSKINLSNEQIVLESNRLIVKSDNFQLDANGDLICNNAKVKGEIIGTTGNIGGWIINDEGLTNGILFIKSSGPSTIYTVADLIILRGHIMGTAGFDLGTSGPIVEHYDLNGDGVVSILDYVRLQNLLGINMDD